MTKISTPFPKDGFISGWIREFNGSSNKVVIATLEGKKTRVIHADLDASTPEGRDAIKIVRALALRDKIGREPARLRLKMGKNPGDTPVIQDAIQPPLYRDQSARKIIDDKGEVISHWSEGLDQAVDEYHDAVMAEQVYHHHALLMASPEAYKGVQKRAEAIFEEIVGKPLRETDAVLPENYPAAAQCGQGDEPNPTCIRYNLLMGFEEQCAEVAGSYHRSTAAANYAIQKAMLDSLVDDVSTGDKSLCQELNEDLYEKRNLIVHHPAMNTEDYRRKSAEVAMMIGAHATSAIFAHTGAKPAIEESDPFKEAGVHRDIEEIFKSIPESEKADPIRSLGNYLSIGSKQMERYEFNSRRMIFEEQLKAKGKNAPLPTAPERQNASAALLAINRSMLAAGVPVIPAETEPEEGDDKKAAKATSHEDIRKHLGNTMAATVGHIEEWFESLHGM